MTEQDAFVQAIFETPDDDTPRLIFADWLEDHHQAERAEFIRGQCELARLPADAPRRAELTRRTEELFDRNDRRWQRPPMIGAHVGNTFHRGFPVEVSYYLRLPNSRLILSPQLLWITQLILDGDLNEANCRALAASPFLGRVAQLNLRQRVICAEGLVALVESPQLQQFRELDLSGGFACDQHAFYALPTTNLEVIQALASTPAADRLTTLWLEHNDLTDEAAEILLASPYLVRLTQMWIAAGNQLSDQALQDLEARYHPAETSPASRTA